MITVTYWKHPSTDCKLILAGTPESTREEALQYFYEDQDQLVGTPGEMDNEAFSKLPEFEG